MSCLINKVGLHCGVMLTFDDSLFEDRVTLPFGSSLLEYCDYTGIEEHIVRTEEL